MAPVGAPRPHPPHIKHVEKKMAEEEVMRKRLAVEGDGGGDDRRVMSLLKTFVRWCNSKGLSDEESEATYQKMLFTLGICSVKAIDKRYCGIWETVYASQCSSIHCTNQKNND